MQAFSGFGVAKFRIFAGLLGPERTAKVEFLSQRIHMLSPVLASVVLPRNACLCSGIRWLYLQALKDSVRSTIYP